MTATSGVREKRRGEPRGTWWGRSGAAVALVVFALIASQTALGLTLERCAGIWMATDADPTYVEGLGTQELRWGDPAGEEKSGFRFDGAGSQTFAIGEPFLLGAFTHFNYLTYRNTGGSRATLEITLNFSDPPISPTIAYTLHMEETENTESMRHCPRWQVSPTPCDDRVWWTDIPDQRFELEGKLYTLQIVGFVDRYPEGEPVEQFVTEEERANVAYLVGRLLVDEPALSVEKRADTDLAGVGDTITYTIIVTNVGQVTLHNVTVVDEKLGLYEVVGTLAPGKDRRLSVPYTVTEADVGRSIENTARAFSDETAAPVTASNAVNVTYTAGLALTAEADKSSATVGDMVNYTITVTNTENVALQSVIVNAPKLGVVNTSIGGLAPNEVRTITATYRVTEADVCGPVTVVATASATDPWGNAVGPVRADVSLSTTYKAEIAIEQRVALTGSATVGNSIPYTVTVKNTGNVTVYDVTVDAPRLGIRGDTSIGAIGPNQSGTVTVTYRVTEADVCGPIVGMAKARATDPCGRPVAQVEAEVSVPTTYTARTSVALKADKTSATLGDVVTYGITVENTGNVTVYNVTVDAPKLGIQSDTSIGALGPGEGGKVVATYRVTEADLCGPIVGTATARATDPCGRPVEPVSANLSLPTSVPPDYKTELSVVVEADKTSAKVGDLVTFTITVGNTGNAMLSNVIVDAPKLGIRSDTSIGALRPGESGRITVAYQVTEADFPGPIVGMATARATDPCGRPVPAVQGSTSVTTDYTARISVVAEADKTSAKVGDLITVTVRVRNTGDVTVHDVTVNAPELGIPSGTSIGTLGPNETRAMSTTYRVTEADVCGPITGTITAWATDAYGQPVPKVQDLVSVNVTYKAEVSVEKDIQRPWWQVVAQEFTLGDQIPYEITVENTGNVTLYDVEVRDDLSGLSETIALLAPGESEVLAVPYTVTVGDVCKPIVSTATAWAADPCGRPVGPVSKQVSTPTTYTAKLSIAIEGLIVGWRKTPVQVGSTVTYSIKVTNTGNVPLSDVRINEQLVGLSRTVANLPPGETQAYELSYTVRQEDVTGQHVWVVAKASAIDPCGQPVGPVEARDCIPVQGVTE